MRSLTTMTAAILLLAFPANSAEPSHPWTIYEAWPFDAAEAKRRQEETAKALGVPVKKTITVGKDATGKPVTMDFMLIPAGTFVLGALEPERPISPWDDRWLGWATTIIGAIAFLALLAVVVVRAIRASQQPQFGLKLLAMTMFAVSIMVLGYSRVRATERLIDEFVFARAKYPQLISEFKKISPLQETLVRITKPFYMGRTEVTNAQWQIVMNATSKTLPGPQLAIDQISWNDCQAFLKNLRDVNARLPTEAEWEYACRSGTGTRYSFGNDENLLGNHAWYWSNSSAAMHPTGAKFPNSWGLHDMHGNLWEWCEDVADIGFTPSAGRTETDYIGYRVMRGGSWSGSQLQCSSHARARCSPDWDYPFMGIRLVCEILPMPAD